MTNSLQADPDITYASDLLLMGGVSKYPIAMQLESDAGEGDCMKVSGSYMYSSVMEPIRLEGHVCPEKGTFLIYHDKGGASEECFEGTLRDGLYHWEGKWKKGDKQLDLDMTLAEELVGEEAVALFMRYVKWDMEGDGEEPPMEDAIVSDAGVDGEGRAFIEGFQPGWNGGIEFFSSTRLSYYTDYTSTARSTIFSYTLQLLTDGKHIVELGTWHNYDKTDDKSDFGWEVSVWRWENGEFEQVEALPEGVEAYASGEAESYEDQKMEVEVSPDRLKLRLGEKADLLKWENGKYVR